MQNAPDELQHAPAMKSGWRLTALVIGLVVAALSIVGFQTWRMMAAERAALIDQFAEEQERQLAEVATALTEDLEDTWDDLRFTARLLSTTERGEGERELRTLLAAVAQYRLAGIYDAPGTRLVQVTDPRVYLAPEPFESTMRATAVAALSQPANALQASPTTTVPAIVAEACGEAARRYCSRRRRTFPRTGPSTRARKRPRSVRNVTVTPRSAQSPRRNGLAET